MSFAFRPRGKSADCTDCVPLFAKLINYLPGIYFCMYTTRPLLIYTMVPGIYIFNQPLPLYYHIICADPPRGGVLVCRTRISPGVAVLFIACVRYVASRAHRTSAPALTSSALVLHSRTPWLLCYRRCGLPTPRDTYVVVFHPLVPALCMERCFFHTRCALCLCKPYARNAASFMHAVLGLFVSQFTSVCTAGCLRVTL